MIFLTVENEGGESPLFFLTVDHALRKCHVMSKRRSLVTFRRPAAIVWTLTPG